MSTFGSVRPEESPAVTNLGRLVARLTLDEVLYEKFESDPAAVIEAAGLKDEERRAIESGDWAEIKKYMGPGPRPVGDEDTGAGPGGG